MKTKILLAAVSAFCLLPSAFGQGALTPPGAPAPTMKTLDQIEPRTPVDATHTPGNFFAQFIISQPGSYYLTDNLTVSSANAINIATNGVTLDLNGFTISSTAASAQGSGIVSSGGSHRDITILNGHIQSGVTNNGSGVFSGGGFANGIYFVNPPANVLVSKVSVSGCLTYGIYLSTGDSTVVESCTARTVGSYGIYASTVKGCGAADCGGFAIVGDQVSDCRGAAVGSGTGIYATIAQNCYGSSSGTGIYATTAQNCVGSSTGNGYGINALIAQNCLGSSGGNGTGISASTAQNCSGSSPGGGGGTYGVYASDIATGCRGYCLGGTGLFAFIANGCRGTTSTGTALSTSHNVNSF